MHYMRQRREFIRDLLIDPLEQSDNPSGSSSSIMIPIPGYRAWHKSRQRMLPVKAIFFPTHVKPIGSVMVVGHEGRYGFDEVILMTRANFATTSGPLYDGDIIHDDRSELQYRIAFRHDFGWEVYEVGGPPDYIDFLLAEDGPHIQVVGNIYENPELLA
jgi:hypothetical protein